MAENFPLVSIGLPIYNGENYLAGAINALLAQDYQNFELIISDNASTDGSRSIYEEYARKDQRIKYSRRERNIGAAKNFKYVLEQASGEYFMWAACDDFWEPGFIRRLVGELIMYPNAVTAMSAINLIDEFGQSAGKIRFDGGNNPNDLNLAQILLRLTGGGGVKAQKYNLYIYGCFRTEIVKRVFRYYDEVYTAEGLFIERLFMTQIAMAGSFRYVDDFLYHRRIHEASGYRQDKNRQSKKNSLLWTHIKSVFRLGKMLWISDITPRSGKKYILPVMWRFLLLFVFGKELRRKISSRLPW